jgi:hypothetical protein
MRKAVLVTVEAVSWRTAAMRISEISDALLFASKYRYYSKGSHMLQNTYLGLPTNLLFDIAPVPRDSTVLLRDSPIATYVHTFVLALTAAMSGNF